VIAEFVQPASRHTGTARATVVVVVVVVVVKVVVLAMLMLVKSLSATDHIAARRKVNLVSRLTAGGV
jgi:hypothetical protein